jgi:hypothetical protein
MNKPFDSALKQLLADFAADWVGWLAPRVGLPADVAVEPLDVELSTVQLSADKVFRLLPPAEGVLHIEPQSSWDGTLAERLNLYNALLHDRYGGPVYSVALLLRREANSPALTGTLTRTYPDGREYLRFGYEVVRVWQLPAEPLLAGGIGALPLALLTDEASGRLGELVDRMDARMRAEHVPDVTRVLVHTSGMLLLGLRYDAVEIQNAFVRARGMKESTTYQAILREGRQEGRQEGLIAGRQEDLLDILRERFGVVPPEVEARVRATTDAARLRDALRRAVTMAALADLVL